MNQITPKVYKDNNIWLLLETGMVNNVACLSHLRMQIDHTTNLYTDYLNWGEYGFRFITAL